MRTPNAAWMLLSSVIIGAADGREIAARSSDRASGLSAAATSLPIPSVDTRRCTMLPGDARLLLRVERDTLMPLAGVRKEVLSYSTPRPPGGDATQNARRDSLRYTPDTPMPSARVRLLDLDSASRAALTAAGITAREPEAFIQAAPYGADCGTVRWMSPEPWVVRGETGYANATLAPRAAWIAGVPTFVIAHAFSYPFPRQLGEVYWRSPNTRLASPQARFSFEQAMAVARQSSASPDQRDSPGQRYSAVVSQLLRWARANALDAEHEPIRQQLRRAVLDADRNVIERRTSRVRGRYRVSMQVSTPSSDTVAHWHFITGERPYYSWLEADSIRSTADIVSSPHVAGYQIVGYAAHAFDSLPTATPKGAAIRDAHLVWLAVADRPGAPGNDTVRVLRAELQFRMSAAPATLWSALEPFATPDTSGATARLATLIERPTRELLQPRIPLTVRIGANGAITADTTLLRNGRRLRVQLTRIDTIAVTRPF